jgi:DNA primase
VTVGLFDRAFLDRIRELVDLPALIGEAVVLKRSGRSFTGLCPFHDDKSPSFTVYPEGHYRCYACPAKGDAFRWVCHRDKVDFREAVARLASSVGLPLPQAIDERPSAERRRTAAIYAALKQAESLYQYGLRRDPQALAYLREERGLTDETIKAAGLGVVGYGIARVLAGRLIESSAIEWSGLVTQHDKRQSEVIRHRIIIPLRNAKGLTVGFAGRAIPGRGTEKPKYLNTPETDVFKKGHELFGFDQARGAIREARSAIVVEGYFDVLSLRQIGECRAVASMGTALTIDQVARLWRSCDIVTLCFDGDRSGAAAALAASKTLLAQMRDGQSIRVCLLPEADDPDSLARRVGIDGWRDALLRSDPLSDLLVRRLTEGLDDVPPEVLVPVALEAREWLDACTHAPLYRQALSAHFKQRLGISL